IINDILDFSKIEAGKLDFHLERFDLRAELAATLKPMAKSAQKKGLALTCHVAPQVPPHLVGDSHRLRQVLVNLLSNAIKFTSEGGVYVSVTVQEQTPTEACLWFSVADTGIGIPAEKLQAIFEAFAQADGSTTRKYGGTGLGLTISTRLVEMMGGRLWVESPAQFPQEPGQANETPMKGGLGSVFHFLARFELPPATTEAEPSSVLCAPPPSSVGQAFAPEKSPSERAAEATPSYRILLAEDNPVNQKLMVRLLKKQGHSVCVVNHGGEALAALAQTPFDLILMDVQMPTMDGFEATAQIRQQETTTGHHIPIIALTAHAMTGDRERCLQAGMDAYLTKPINREALEQVLARIMTPTTK
ncbi:MAG TPA: response regulator, partial [Blastocatellia bacterium]|nr:response regulator [Blastocatellia bacterium]